MGYLTSPVVAELHKARVRTVVEHALRRSIYVVMDWHDSTAQSHKKEFIAFFKQMATECGNRPNVLFEIYNEPVGRPWNDLKPAYHLFPLETVSSL